MPPAMLHDRNIIITHPPGPVYQVGNDTPHFNIVQGVPFQRLTIISNQRLPAALPAAASSGLRPGELARFRMRRPSAHQNNTEKICRHL